MRTNDFNLRKGIVDYASIIFGICLYSLGFCAFLLPHTIVIGGMAGFSSLVFYATGQHVPLAVIMYAANIMLLLCGLRVLGRSFALRTIFGATVMSFAIGSIEDYFMSHAPLVTSTMMSVIVGSVLMGIGIGIYYSHHGTAGGTDIVAAIIEKKSNVSMGRVFLIVDMSIVALSFFLPFDGDIEARVQARTETIIYGWLSICIYSWLADKYLKQGNQTVQFIIISERWKDISYRISHETGRGVTTWDAHGYWTGEMREIMLVWCRVSDTAAIYRIANEVDPSAYITTSYVRSVYGNGFDMLKLRSHKPKKQCPTDKRESGYSNVFE